MESPTTLQEAIFKLEQQQAYEGLLLKQQFHLAYESIKPINLIKNTLAELSHSNHFKTDLKANLVNTAVGLGVGYVSKKLFVSMSSSPIKKLIGTALLIGITNLVSKHPEGFKTLAAGIFNLVREKLADLMQGDDDDDARRNFS